MVKFTLEQVAPKIWHLNFSSSYDLTMHFFRFQEWYESPTMMEKNVQFVDLMENYTSKLGKGKFTYTHDWAGFNIPGEQIFARFEKGISDPNRHDDLMHALATYIRAKEGGPKFYIIGTSDDDSEKNTTFNHELAHGMFYADEAYKARMTKYVEGLPDKVRNKIFSTLKKWGYADKFFIDETQAYMATGLQSPIDTQMIRDHQAKFKRLFNSYSKGARKRPERTVKVKSGTSTTSTAKKKKAAKKAKINKTKKTVKKTQPRKKVAKTVRKKVTK